MRVRVFDNQDYHTSRTLGLLVSGAEAIFFTVTFATAHHHTSCNILRWFLTIRITTLHVLIKPLAYLTDQSGNFHVVY